MSRRTLILLLTVAGLLLLAAPLIVRTTIFGYGLRGAALPPPQPPLIAATPAPTTTPAALDQTVARAEPEVGLGPVVVDLAHFSQLNPAGLQPLASALAQRGLATRLWLSTVDALGVESVLDFPDQSKELAAQLRDAGALVVVSPFFLYSPQEIAVVQRFVADGGRLLLVSDPDIFSDAAVYLNLLAEPFGVVFNDDYLYDTTRNDENFTHFFVGGFEDRAAPLDGAQIALYGARSIGGDVAPQARSAPTTLSSLRAGVSGFTVLAIGGDSGHDTAGRVLALSDFDVLTEPNVARHDNRQLVDFVAGFLAEGVRASGVADFPSTFGKHVTLQIGMQGALDAESLLLGARLQRRLEETGRTLDLAALAPLTTTPAISDTAPAAAPGGTIPSPETATTEEPPSSLITDTLILSDFDYANEATSLLSDAGIALVVETITPTVAATPPSPTPTPSPVPDGADARRRLDPTPSPTAPATATPIPTLPSFQGPEPTPTADPADPAATPGGTNTQPPAEPISATVTATATRPLTATPASTPTPTPTPVEVSYLVGPDGLRLLASQTALIIQRRDAIGSRIVAVLGADSAGIRSAVDRLLANDFADCIIGREVTLCPVAPAAGGSGSSPTATRTPAPSGTGTPTPTPGGSGPATPGATSILLVDDNTLAKADERAEADRYLQVLSAAGHTPDLWTTAERGAPTADDLEPYAWVIWSNAGYADGTVDVALLDPLFAYLNQGGRLTVSSRKPFFGMGVDPAAPIAEVVAVQDAPELVTGLPTEPIPLSDAAAVIPLAAPEADEGFLTVLARSPASEAAGLPAAIAATDEGEAEAVGARLIVAALSVTWLPPDVSERFIRNMAEWQLAD